MSLPDDERASPARIPSPSGSGPVVARAFQILLALVFLIAWSSLGAQVAILVGSRGLLPVAPFLEAARRAGGPSFAQFPTLFWLGASDLALEAGIVAGIGLALAALAGLRPRLCFLLSTLLYLSYATACRTFLSFQWDNLLLECGILAVFLPTDRPARWIHVLFRLLLFKLYWESGIAKMQSYIGDWFDGSAMTYYYETAPLPTWLALYAHALPAWWHHFESRAVLVLEMLVPVGFFGPRRLRLAACALLTGFQVVNIATANYGFFCYLALALHVFLLDDGDLVRIGGWLRLRLGRPLRVRPARPPTAGGWLRTAGAALVVAVFVSLSLLDGLLAFGGGGAWRAVVEPVRAIYQPWRLVNTYHLFGQITRERIEPEFQTSSDGAWTAHDFRYKPGDPRRAPRFVAPHQPRVDFQLWFYGLGYRRGTPAYVAALVRRLCLDPEAVQGLFPDPLPPHPEAVRIVFWQYHFTTPSELASSGAWWTRRRAASTRSIECDGFGS